MRVSKVFFFVKIKIIVDLILELLGLKASNLKLKHEADYI